MQPHTVSCRLHSAADYQGKVSALHNGMGDIHIDEGLVQQMSLLD